MNGRELSDLVENDPYARRTFRGVFPRDHLSSIEVIARRPSAFIINTGESWTSGEHWVALWFDGRGKSGYFDSFGLPPRHEDIEDFLLRHSVGYRHNTRVIQSPTSAVCGLYCAYYVLRKSRGDSLPRIVSIFHPSRQKSNDLKIKLLFRGKMVRRRRLDVIRVQNVAHER